MLTQVRWGTLPLSLPRPLDWCQHQPHTEITVDTCILIEKHVDRSSAGLPLVGWPLVILLCDIIICLLSSMFMWDPIYICMMYHLDTRFGYIKSRWRSSPLCVIFSVFTTHIISSPSLNNINNTYWIGLLLSSGAVLMPPDLMCRIRWHYQLLVLKYCLNMSIHGIVVITVSRWHA